MRPKRAKIPLCAWKPISPKQVSFDLQYASLFLKSIERAFFWYQNIWIYVYPVTGNSSRKFCTRQIINKNSSVFQKRFRSLRVMEKRLSLKMIFFQLFELLTSFLGEIHWFDWFLTFRHIALALRLENASKKG